MTIKALYPNVRPTLNLDFAKTKALDPRVTFTRASTGTFVGSNGLIQTAASGAARFDHNPATGESLGLLVEEARTNRALYSEQFDNAAWSKLNTTIGANAVASPDGTLTADTFVESTDGSNQQHYINQSYSVTSGTSYTYTVFAKYVSRQWLVLTGNRNNWQAYFDIQNGVVGNKGSLVSSSSITALANGWYRCSVTVVADSTISVAFQIYAATANGTTRTPVYIGTGANAFYIWGFQLETGSFLTSYIPTVASTVTRAADVATLANTGSSIFPTSAFTTVNSPFGTAGGGSTVKLVGPTVKRTAVYNGDLTQAQINALASVNDDFWRWRVLGSSFALPSFTTDGSVTVDWGDGVVETLTTAVHTFTNGGGYHDIGFRLNSGTFFKPNINGNSTYGPRVIAVGPAPASMKIDANNAFYGCGASLKCFDATVDVTGGTNLTNAWQNCTSLTSFPLINTAAGTNFNSTWFNCSSLTSFPLINTAAGTIFYNAWGSCSSLTSFPLINTAAGTNFQSAWYACSGLTSFPLINTGAGTNFRSAWFNCSGLTSFPLINTAAGTTFQQAWTNCSSLTSFPLIDTAAGTNFSSGWTNCSSLTSFPLIDTAAGTTFQSAWDACSGLTSFPLINTAAGISFSSAWRNSSSLTSFPPINTAAGTNFQSAWQNCSSLTSFPLINTGSGTNFQSAWQSCSSLTSFPANMFDTTGTLIANAFSNAFAYCALTAASIENILTSLVTNGRSNIALGLQGGTNAGASTWTANAVTAYNTLISRGWTISRNA
jgi:hypothetical protein